MSEKNKQKFGKHASTILIFILIISFGFLSLQAKAALVFKEIRQWQIASDAIAIENDATAIGCSNASTCAVTLNVPATATMVVVAVGVRDAETITSVSDSDGDTYIIALSQGTDPTVAIYYTTTITANATKTITANLSASTADTVIDAYTLTGTETSSPIDATVTNTGSGATANANITTNNNDSLIAFMAMLQSNGTINTIGTGQVERGSVATGGQIKYVGTNTSEITTSSGNNDQTVNWSKSATWRTVAVEIKMAPFTGDTLTFSLGANTLALGTLSSSAVQFNSHTMNVATSASSGMVVIVSGATLTFGGNTIDACGSGCSSSTGTEQFGINLKDNATPNVGAEATGSAPIGVAATNYNTVDSFRFVTGEVVASSTANINDTTFTISYIANITSTTEAGTYQANLTYIATGTF